MRARFLGLLILPALANAAVVTRSGTLTANETWTSANTYYVNSSLTVDTGVTLTIEAGTVVKFAAVSMTVNGTLNVNGGSGNEVIFTSDEDESVGDDTDPGTPTTPARGNYNGIDINGAANMAHFEIRYAGNSNSAFDAALHADSGSSVTLNTFEIRDSDNEGILITDANPTIIAGTFRDNIFGDAIRLNVDSNPTITNPTFSNNATNGARVSFGTSAGDIVLDDPDVVYVVDGFTLPVGNTLSIAAGQIIKSGSSLTELFINGTMNAPGTSGSPIIITSLQDDAAGGDTNNDGAGTPAGGNWEGILINGDADLDYVTIRYAGNSNSSYDANLSIQGGGTVSLDNCSITDSDNEGILIVSSNPSITNCAFNDSVFGDAIRMNVDSDPTITNPTFSNNATNGARVSFGTSAGDIVLDDPDVVYVVDGFTLPVGNTLSIAPGQIIKSGSSLTELFINGTMNAPGTSGSPIVITSLQDDAAGGDTNNDGNVSTPASGNWEGILISGDADLDHVKIRYAGNSNSSYDANLSIQGGGTVTLDDCTISDSDNEGILILDSDPVITNCSFADNGFGAAIRSNVDSAVSVVAPTFTNNAINGWQVFDGTTTRDIVWNSPDTVISTGTVTVGVGTTLTVGAGQIVKVGGSLVTDGTLDVQGTPGQPAIFTSYRDDSVGGDTNNDGPSVGVPADWSAIWADGGTVMLDHVQARFGGTTNSSARSILNAINMGMITASNVVIDSSFTAGMACDGSSQITAENVISSRNRSEGVRANGGCNVTLTNATISNNSTAVFANASTIDLINANLTFSSFRSIDVVSGGDATVQSSNIFPAGTVSGVADPIGSNGNISADPRYVSATGGDYRLLGDSGSIDAGTSNGAPTTDIFGNARFDNILIANTGLGATPFVDIGAIERQDGIPGRLLPIAEDNEAGDRFGSAVSADGNRVAVGIPNVDVDGVDDGQVLIFELNGDRFELAAIINVPPGFFAVNFGAAIDLEGNAVLIGAPGTSAQTAKHLPQAKQGLTAMQAAIFERASRTMWQLKVPMTPIDGNADDMFGASVALDGSTAVVGAPGDAEVVVGGGAAHVFEVDGSSVADSFKINPIAAVANAGFGTAVAASGNMVAAGAPGDNLQGALSGSVSVYQQVASNLSSLDLTGRVTSSGAGDGDQFGTSVALSGDQLLVGAPMEGSNDAGAAYLFEAGGSVRQLGRLAPDAPAANGHVGMAVALDGGDLVAGAPGMNAGVGAVLRFDLTFRQVERLDGPEGGAGFGMALARRGNVLAVGAPDSNAAEGAAFSQLRDALLQFASGFE